jgi:hypothetical protein
MKLILLNGPPRSGKDTAAAAIETFLLDLPSLPFVVHDKLSAPIKYAFCAMMRAKMDGFNVDYYEAHKEEVIPAIGKSYRQWQIDFSERFMKPCYGIDIFSRLLWSRLEEQAADYAIISDCGFQIEIDYLLAKVEPADVCLFRLNREGCSFSGDSRQYVFAPTSVCTFSLRNEGWKQEYEDSVLSALKLWLEE